MNKIVVNLGNYKLDEITLNRGTLNIGRASDNEISLADSATSAHHAKIVTIFTSSFIQDLNSTNGTIVNGRKILRHTLAHGDIISIGNLQLLFKSDATTVAEKPTKSIHISKQEINSALTQSPLANKKPENAHSPVTEILKKDDKLAGFSISIPSAEELVENAQGRMPAAMPEPAQMPPSIPVLDETLPLGELRRNPDRMVVLDQYSPAQDQDPELDTGEDTLASKISTKSEDDTDKNAIPMDIGMENNILEDNQIRQMLLDKDNQDNHTKLYAKYGIALTMILVIVAFIYILV